MMRSEYPDRAARLDFGWRLEPGGDRVLLCAGQDPEEFGAGLRSLGRPAYVRICFAFNGPWFGYPPEPGSPKRLLGDTRRPRQG
jgi:hypothetical protein